MPPSAPARRPLAGSRWQRRSPKGDGPSRGSHLARPPSTRACAPAARSTRTCGSRDRLADARERASGSGSPCAPCRLPPHAASWPGPHDREVRAAISASTASTKSGAPRALKGRPCSQASKHMDGLNHDCPPHVRSRRRRATTGIARPTVWGSAPQSRASRQAIRVMPASRAPSTCGPLLCRICTARYARDTITTKPPMKSPIALMASQFILDCSRRFRARRGPGSRGWVGAPARDETRGDEA